MTLSRTSVTLLLPPPPEIIDLDAMVLVFLFLNG